MQKLQNGHTRMRKWVPRGLARALAESAMPGDQILSLGPSSTSGLGC